MSARKVPGSCYCGAIRFELELPTRFVAHCHCANCRRAHGAGHVTWAGVMAEQWRVTAGAELLVPYRTDTDATRRFCGRCGSTLTFESPRWAGQVHVVVANLDGELDELPGGHAFADRAPAWCPITDDLPQFGGEDGGTPL